MLKEHVLLEILHSLNVLLSCDRQVWHGTGMVFSSLDGPGVGLAALTAVEWLCQGQD